MSRDLAFDEVIAKLRKDWFEMGNNLKGDYPSVVAMRFVSYWIAFNAFYAHYYNKSVSDEEDSEVNQIKRFLKQNKIRFENLFDFETDEYIKVFMEFPVFKGENRHPEENVDYSKCFVDGNDPDKYPIINFKTLCNKNKSYFDRLTALILIIYQIRCNLFHGDKGLNSRNYDLVNNSQVILEKVLSALLEKK